MAETARSLKRKNETIISVSMKKAQDLSSGTPIFANALQQQMRSMLHSNKFFAKTWKSA